MSERTEALARVPLFASLSKRRLQRIAKGTLDYRYESGHILIEQGEEGETLFVILAGTANVIRGGRVRARIGPGEFVGEIAVLRSRPRTARVVADSDMRCVVLHRDELRKILHDEPALAWEMLGELATRLKGD